jgi:hypothetical protein
MFRVVILNRLFIFERDESSECAKVEKRRLYVISRLRSLPNVSPPAADTCRISPLEILRMRWSLLKRQSNDWYLHTIPRKLCTRVTNHAHSTQILNDSPHASTGFPAIHSSFLSLRVFASGRSEAHLLKTDLATPLKTSHSFSISGRYPRTRAGNASGFTPNVSHVICGGAKLTSW